jgi:hypothetical protein
MGGSGRTGGGERVVDAARDRSPTDPAWQPQQNGQHERPREALGGDLPNERWEPSPREYPARVTPPEYPGHLEVRRVSGAGLFRLGERDVFLSSALANEPIGLEPVDDRIWSIVYYRTLLGRIDERTGEITGAGV